MESSILVTNYLASFNLLLGIVGFGWLAVRTRRRWDEYPDEMQMLLTLTLALFFGLLVVSGEVLLGEFTLALSVGVITVVKVFALIALWLTRDTLYRTGTRDPENGDVDITDVNKDLDD